MNARHITGSAAAATALAALALTSTVSAAPNFVPVSGTHDATTNSSPVGFGDAFGPDTDDAVSQYVFVEGESEVRTYCIEIGVDFMADGSNWEATPHSSVRAANGSAAIPAATWVARNGTLYSAAGAVLGTIDSPTGDSAADGTDGAWGALRFDEAADGIPAAFFNDAEASAMQLAIWSLVNNADITQTVSAAILDRANELIDLADGEDNIVGTADDLSVPEAPHSYSLEVEHMASSGTAGTISGSLQGMLSNATTTAVSGIEIEITAPSGVDLDVDVDGVQSSRSVTTTGEGEFGFEISRTNEEPVTVTAMTSNLEVAPGVVLTPEDSNGEAQQQVITAEYGAITRTADVSVEASVTPPPTTEPPTTEPPTTEPPTTEPPTTEPPTTEPPTTEPPTTEPPTTEPPTTEPPTATTSIPESLPVGGSLVSPAVLLGAFAASLAALAAASRRRQSDDS